MVYPITIVIENCTMKKGINAKKNKKHNLQRCTSILVINYIALEIPQNKQPATDISAVLKITPHEYSDKTDSWSKSVNDNALHAFVKRTRRHSLSYIAL